MPDIPLYLISIERPWKKITVLIILNSIRASYENKICSHTQIYYMLKLATSIRKIICNEKSIIHFFKIDVVNMKIFFYKSAYLFFLNEFII